MKRFEDWPLRLEKFLAEAEQKTFEWGSFDCCLFSCDAVLATTGVDLAAGFRGQYSSELGAAKLLTRYRGVPGVAWKIAAEHGILEVPVLMAQRGDVVMIDSPLGPTLGIVGLHGHKAKFITPEGLKDYPVGDCTKAWRI